MADGMKNKAWIKEKLVFNADKDFVQRLFKKDAPHMDLGNNRFATHQMSWSHTGPPKDPNTKIIVYPNIIHNKKTKGLEWLSGRNAQEYAERTGEYIQVDSPEQAEVLSTEYKEVVPGFHDRPGGGGPGSMSYVDFETEEEKLQKKVNMRKLGLAPPEPKLPKVGKPKGRSGGGRR